MTFELETATTSKLTDVVVLSQKNRQPDDLPGAKLSIEMALGNDSLAYFDGSLKSFLFTKNGSGPVQAGLDGIAPVSDTPNLTKAGSHLGQLDWELELTGYTLTLDLGIGGKQSNLEIEDCVLGHFRLLPKEGGTVLVRFDIESENVSEKHFGKLATLKSREISILLAPPEIAQKDLDVEAPVAKGGKAQLSDEAAWPFPKNGSTTQAPDAPPAHITEPKVSKAARKRADAGKAH